MKPIIVVTLSVLIILFSVPVIAFGPFTEVHFDNWENTPHLSTMFAAIDESTGLMWQESSYRLSGFGDANDAKQYCENLINSGFSDWRLPRIDELRTIANYNGEISTYTELSGDVVTIARFLNHAQIWSSTERVGYSGALQYTINGANGAIQASEVSQTSYDVRCVRGGPFWEESPSFTIQNENRALDKKTNLIWYRQSSDRMTWDQARNYCQSLKIDGYKWRLPEISELQSVIDYTKNPQIDEDILDFPQFPEYWSSTLRIGYSDIAWMVLFNTGTVFLQRTESLARCRCVTSSSEKVSDDQDPSSCAEWMEDKIGVLGFTPDGAIHAIPNTIPPRGRRSGHKVAVKLTGHIMDKIAALQNKSIKAAYIEVNDQKITLMNEDINFLSEDGKFEVTTEVTAGKGASYNVSLFVIDPDGYEVLVDETMISILKPHSLEWIKKAKKQTQRNRNRQSKKSK